VWYRGGSTNRLTERWICPLGSRSFRASFFSAAAVVVVLLIVVCLNLILSRVNLRWDTTRQKAYSLSQGTHTILAELERDVTIKVFYSSSLANTPVSIRTHAGRLQDFLAEYELYSRGRVRVERYDPKMDSVAEKWAQTYGIQKLPLASGEGLYFGLVALAGGQDDVIAFLEPARERQLEYDITRLITRVQSTRQPKIGVISGLPVFGETAAPFAVPGQPPPAPPWFFISELRKTYAVTEIDPSAEGLVEELDLLLVVHPAKLAISCCTTWISTSCGVAICCCLWTPSLLRMWWWVEAAQGPCNAFSGPGGFRWMTIGS
jgi:ABC-type uncharacterized transport system involved in gliding motility auxiliary subunit